MSRIDGTYLCIKDRIKFKGISSLNIFSGTSYYCSEIIDGMIKIFVTDNSHTYMSFREFQQHFYCLKETRQKKLQKIGKWK